MVNNSSYGLNVGIYTSNITNALNSARKFETGGV
ncbi:hypothetical protein QUF56_07135 [Ureibacillus composti]|nr:hypothetical protein [Ureibacillus composti]HWJ78945.1 hypothetical protein [Niallia sp.]